MRNICDLNDLIFSQKLFCEAFEMAKDSINEMPMSNTNKDFILPMIMELDEKQRQIIKNEFHFDLGQADGNICNISYDVFTNRSGYEKVAEDISGLYHDVIKSIFMTVPIYPEKLIDSQDCDFEDDDLKKILVRPVLVAMEERKQWIKYNQNINTTQLLDNDFYNGNIKNCHNIFTL